MKLLVANSQEILKKMKLSTPRIWSKLKLPKLILTDIDGVWTDGGMYYSEKGEELKKFNTSDSAGVILAHLLNIPVGIITGENSQAVAQRGKKIKIDYVFLGTTNKLAKAKELCEELGFDLMDVAYIGDDLNDILLLRNVGLSACPSNAPIYVKDEVDWKLKKSGGEGAFREFVERIIIQAGLDPKELYLSNLE
jgi:3-deoxy-D-manno-octulosonate 8-phosphate phosphatase (KDO 8-P phosphatase)